MSCMEALTTEMILVMAMIALAVFLFVVEWLRVDVVAILIMVALPLLGLVTPQVAFSGLSSNAVVSIIAVIIIGAGLDKTGVVNALVKPVLRVAGDSPPRGIIALRVVGTEVPGGELDAEKALAGGDVRDIGVLEMVDEGCLR